MKSNKKNIFSYLLVLTSILTSVASLAVSPARITDGKDHLKFSKTKIIVTLDKGFHFVMQSPAGLYIDGELGSTEPAKKTENQIVFDVAHVKDRSFTLSYYVCDDQKTVCESHESHLKLEKGKMIPFVSPKE